MRTQPDADRRRQAARPVRGPAGAVAVREVHNVSGSVPHCSAATRGMAS